MTALYLPPPDPHTGVVGHAYVVGSATALAGDLQQAYIVKMRLNNLSVV